MGPNTEDRKGSRRVLDPFSNCSSGVGSRRRGVTCLNCDIAAIYWYTAYSTSTLTRTLHRFFTGHTNIYQVFDDLAPLLAMRNPRLRLLDVSFARHRSPAA